MTDNGAHSFTEGSEPIKLTELEKAYKIIEGLIKDNQRLQQQLKEERNKAIDECMREIERLNDDGVLYESTARKVLESLKLDSK